MVGHNQRMPRHRFPLLIRALLLFLASLPAMRAGAADAHGSGTLPAHEAPAPSSAAWIRPAPMAVAAGAITAVVAGAAVAQRPRTNAAMRVVIAEFGSRQQADDGSAAAPRVPNGSILVGAAPAALHVLALASRVASPLAAPAFIRRSLPTPVRAQAP